MKATYSCMVNIKSFINIHNKEVITKKKTQVVNSIDKPDCPFSNQCQMTTIIQKTKITTNLRNYHGKIYYETSEGTFQQRYGNHKKSFSHENHRTNTQLSKEYWRLQELNAQPQVQFYISKKCRTTKRTGICYLCLNEKQLIIEHQGNDLINQSNELVSKWRRKNKFKLMNQNT